MFVLTTTAATTGVDSYKFRYYIQGPVCSDSCANPIEDLPELTITHTAQLAFMDVAQAGCLLLAVAACTGTPADGYVSGFTPVAKTKLSTFCDACYSSGQGGSSVTTGSGCSAKRGIHSGPAQPTKQRQR